MAGMDSRYLDWLTIKRLLAVGLYLLGPALALQADSWVVKELAYDLDTAEGPVWDPEGKLYFTEIFARKVHEYTVETGTFRVIRENSGGANGMAFDSENRLLMCEMLEKRFVRREKDGSIVPLWERGQEDRGGPNDVVVSSRGITYFTMPRQGIVYRMTLDDELTPFITAMPGINGVMLSKDEDRLFVTEYKYRKVHVFPIDDKQGMAGPGQLFAEIQTKGTEHGTDGMAIDNKDQLYVTCLGGIWIFDTQGNQTDFIPLPNEKVTNCAFAGEDFDTLYITTQQGLFVAKRKME